MVAVVLSARGLLAALTLSVASVGVPAGDAGALGAALPGQIRAVGAHQSLRINGLDMRSRGLRSDLLPEDACALLERAWQGDASRGPPAHCARASQWLLIAHRTGRVLQTVQLERNGQGSAGFISELDALANPGARAQPQLPLPAGVRVLNAVQSVELGDVVAQFTLRMPGSPVLALQRIRNAASDRGWSAVGAGSNGMLDFQRGAIAARAIATATPPGTTVVLVEHQSAGIRP